MAAIVIWLAVLTAVVIVWLISLSCTTVALWKRKRGVLRCEDLMESQLPTVSRRDIEALKVHLDVTTQPCWDRLGEKVLRHNAVPISRCSKCEQEVPADGDSSSD